MSGKDTEYTKLPFLDSQDMPQCRNQSVNQLKIPLRNAINHCRYYTDSMNELHALLKHCTDHIESAQKPKRKRRVKKDPETEYDLP